MGLHQRFQRPITTRTRQIIKAQLYRLPPERRSGLRACARHRGVSHRTIQKALARGRIAALRREGNRILIDSNEADRRWAQWQDQAQQQSAEQQRRSNQTSRAFAAARALKENYRARLRQLEHDQRTGKLVHVDDVKVAAFNSARSARDALLGIADRVAPQVPGRSLEGVRSLLLEELQRVCEIIGGERTAA